MNSEDYDKLSDEEKRIKVAELCGFGRIHVDTIWMGTEGSRDALFGDIRKSVAVEIPDYLNDLNACHEFSKLINRGSSQTIYQHHMVEIQGTRGRDRAWEFHNATAEQRCKAFVLTMADSKGKLHTAYEEVGYTGMAAQRLVEGENKL